MTDILYKMQDSLLRYAKISSWVIQMPITVVDQNQIRINYEGGQWAEAADVGHSMSERGGISRAVIDTGEPQVMLEPRGHPACRSCPNWNKCPDYAELWVPIKQFQTVIGAIAIICETKRQVQRVRKNWQSYLQFLEQIAELIAFDVKQRAEVQRDQTVIELLTTVMNRINSGVIVLDAHDNILRSNVVARQMLSNKLPNLLENGLTVISTGEEYKTYQLYRLQSGDDSCIVVGSLHHVRWEPYSSFLIFDSVNRIPTDATSSSAFYQITGTSLAIQKVRDQVETAAHSHSCVLLKAESGLGRELYARAIHDESDRSAGPFITINCASLPEYDAEKYLLGVNTTSGTAGAHGKAGELEQANGGTLFLDNISALPYPIQQQLVKMVEQRELMRTGSKRVRRVNIRLIAGTNRDLREMCESGAFDFNLYYLISVLPISIPPLRMRPEDIHPLALHYIHRYSQELNKSVASIDEEFWTRIEQYDWPGNVRELQSCMERVVNMMNNGVIQAELLPDSFRAAVPAVQPGLLNLEALEKETISRALILQRQEKLSMEKIAKILGIGPATLYRKIKKYGL